jgi:hypothetical protein
VVPVVEEIEDGLAQYLCRTQTEVAKERRGGRGDGAVLELDEQERQVEIVDDLPYVFSRDV